MQAAATGSLANAFVQYREALLAFAIVLVRSRDLAEEVLSEASIAVLEADARGTRPDHVGAWLRALVRHRAADHFRKRALADRFETMADAVETAFAETWIDAEAAAVRARHLSICLDKLAPRARQIVDERYRRGRSIEDVARAVGWKPNPVKVALAKARRALANCMQRRMEHG
jgi:RNA polymerase sigma-70 factor (ECF subfamily)